MDLIYNLIRAAGIGIFIFSGVTALLGKSLILPIEAIYDSGRLSIDKFQEKYPGIDVSSDIPDVEGYYIRYSHENLTYYFGPVEDYLTAEQKSFELQDIVDLATFENPNLQNSEIYVWQFNHDMFEQALGGSGSDMDQEGLQVAEIDGGAMGAASGSRNMEGGQIITADPSSRALGTQVMGEQSSDSGQPIGGMPGQPNSMSGQQQIQQIGGQMGQMQNNSSSNQNQSNSQSSQSASSGGGQSGQGGGSGSSSGSSQSQGQQQQQGGGMSIWQMLGKMLFGR